MTGALIGLAATAVAAGLALVGALRTGRAPAHLADVEGLARLADELRIELERVKRQRDECWKQLNGRA